MALIFCESVMSVIPYIYTVPFVTKDGSVVRELMHPARHSSLNQSLAEAIVPTGVTTKLHQHRRSEEIYHIAAGQGWMTRGEEGFAVEVGDTVCFPSGTPHKIANTGTADLRIFCCCAPAYSHNDTDLLE